ncbi:alkaline phosphatase [Ixodes scapularis]|uniref:alkaline phosphatase n=1 Tax=Ixodes scapularis TaxID=6945 RepID=UPI001A9EE617|nr:alkaline phosphatase [Ixodes scapularis]
MLGASGMAAVGPVFFALVLFLGSATDGGEGLSFFPVPDAEKEAKSSFWFDQGMSDIEARLKIQHSTGLAKRVVIFLGDGMGLSTVTAARIYKGQKQRKASGEESVLSWDAFPHVSLSRTYGLNVQTSDSANTATAYLCGVKANYETLGVDSRIRSGDCHSDPSTHLPSIMQWAQAAGLWTGVVTTTRITDATPAASYAHAGYRKWQSSVPDGCAAKDIAYQLVHNTPGSQFKVILGGGRGMFLDKSMKDEEGQPGDRADGLNLIQSWKDSKKDSANASFIWTRQQLLGVKPERTGYLLGLFDKDHLPYVPERSDPDTTKPTLPEMTKVALDILLRSPSGFVLLVEGGRIDHGHHVTRAGLAMEEALEFDRAVEDTVRRLGSEDSLIVVTADHSHTFTMGGYPKRGNNILGIAGYSDVDQLPFTSLAYGNGPNSRKERTNFTEDETTSMSYVQHAAFPAWLETHAGEDVAVYATGPWAHLFSGVHDQTYIPHVLAYAACIGQFAGDGCHARRAPTR